MALDWNGYSRAEALLKGCTERSYIRSIWMFQILIFHTAVLETHTLHSLCIAMG